MVLKAMSTYRRYRQEPLPDYETFAVRPAAPSARRIDHARCPRDG